MSYKTFTHFHCEACDYRAVLIESENDQPYSKEWRSERVQEGDYRVQWGGSETTYKEAGQPCPRCKA